MQACLDGEGDCLSCQIQWKILVAPCIAPGTSISSAVVNSDPRTIWNSCPYTCTPHSSNVSSSKLGHQGTLLKSVRLGNLRSAKPLSAMVLPVYRLTSRVTLSEQCDFAS